MRALLIAALALLPLAAQPESQLQTARSLLTGEHKDAEAAKLLLLEIVKPPVRVLDPETVTYAYVYLGYIEDRAGHREPAIAWFRKALAVEGAAPGILVVARAGLDRPVTWIRHLDQPSAPAAPSPSATPAVEAIRPAKAYVTPEAPTDLTLQRNLTERQRRDNFEALWSAIDTTYACFKLKSIDWGEIGKRYRTRLSDIRDDDAFYDLLFQLVNELHDTHSWLQNYRPPPLFDSADLAVDLFGEKLFVVAVRPGSSAATAGVAPGWEVLSVDGSTLAKKMEALRPRLHAASTERAWRREAARRLLASPAASPATVELRSPQGAAKTLTVPRTAAVAPRPRYSPPDIKLTRQHFVHFGIHPSGLGYIRIESFNGRDEIVEEFDRALAAVRNTPGLLLDIRDNTGGFGQPKIVGRLLAGRAIVGISYTKNGFGHSHLDRRHDYLNPTGPWQYTRPVALLINDVTGSAADLFASELRSAGRIVTVGTATHGNLSGVAAFAVLPCGLVVRVSNGYVADAKDHAIEGAGTVPDFAVEPTVDDFLAGRDPVIERAVAELRK